jgi:hypothetical protein
VEPDLPSIKRLKTKADELCDELKGELKRKEERISTSNAYYYFNQEVIRHLNELGPEFTKHELEKLKRLLETALDWIK